MAAAVVPEPARLTSMLRAFMTERGKAFDYESEVLKRFEQRRTRTPSIAPAKGRALAWNTDFAPFIATKEVEGELRAQYHAYLKVIKELLGDDEVTEDDLLSAAALTFAALRRTDKSDSEKQTALKKYFPTLKSVQYKKALPLVTYLHEWKETHKDTQLAPAPTTVVQNGLDDEEEGTIDLEEDGEEFGANLLPVTPLTGNVEEMPESESKLPVTASSTPTPRESSMHEDTMTSAQRARASAAVDEMAHEHVDEFWLGSQCARWTRTAHSAFTAAELTQTISQLLGSAQTSEALQSALMDLLGSSAPVLEFINLLISYRLEVLHAQLKLLEAEEAEMGRSAKATQTSSEFVIKSRKEEDFARQHKKQVRKLRTQIEKISSQEKAAGRSAPTIDELDKDYLRRVHEAKLLAGPDMTLHETVEREESGWGKGFVLPPEATRSETDKALTVRIPAPAKPPRDTESLVAVADMDSFAQLAFHGFRHLNRMQSKVYPIAYHSNTNLLVAAPTGAGKTNVALLCMLHACKQFVNEDGILEKDRFKIVYVAPMKALAAEMTASFQRRLNPLGLLVKELTGDMQLTKKELTETQVIITTPEKWDVITRKSSDVALTQIVSLLIIDEVHLLHSERGPVLESLVARTLRQVEQSQSMIRIVGLSATLPNYADVAQFLKVDPQRGLFHFDGSYRPVPLATSYIGVKGNNNMQTRTRTDELCFKEVERAVLTGDQVMVFVHSRKATVTTAKTLLELAQAAKQPDLFEVEKKCRESREYQNAQRDVSKSRNRELSELFPHGFGFHHAGMLRADRSLVERLFLEGHITVLVCTATLAWGVNLPAHSVIIKGTQLYNPARGGFVDLGILDVMQIFGRAGRPQFDDSGEATIITAADKVPHYLALMAHQLPIESQFIHRLPDHLNAEIVLGTVANLRDAITWLSYTYLHIRMLKNPLVYGSTILEREVDPQLIKKRTDLIVAAARRLDKCRMIRFDERGGNFYATDLGRTASHYYIAHESIELFNAHMHNALSDSAVLEVVSQATEFSQIKVREDEVDELEELEDFSLLAVRGGVLGDDSRGKVNVLLQAYISHAQINSFSLVSDMNYIAQNAGRVMRALFDIALKSSWTSLATKLLQLSIMVERKIWSSQHPLRQFDNLGPMALKKLEESRLGIDRLRDMSAKDVAALLNQRVEGGKAIRLAARQLPRLEADVELSPITRTIIRVALTLRADFTWNDRVHGAAEPFWIWVVKDDRDEQMVHKEYFILHKKQYREELKLNFIIPIYADPVPSQYFLHIYSDRWLGSASVEAISFKDIVLPDHQPPHTELLPLQPLPVSALMEPEFEALYPFAHFNRVQTQSFFTLYRTDVNVLMGAPTGSGKTICAELAMLRVLSEGSQKIVYIGPLKALVRERIKDWEVRFGQKLGKKVLELTGDTTPELHALERADIILTTPEKWDGISRNWQQREYVQRVGLLILDEIHLLGVQRGNILEVIVSRMRYISSHTERPVRFVGLSTALANPEDLADWLGIESPNGLFNFHPSVRPVPLRLHLQGYPGKHYCPRMKTMNKPAYAAILQHSPLKPVLIFVSSRRQTRLTALDLISYLVGDDNPKQWLHCTEEEMELVLAQVHDENLRHTLEFGIGLHHAGLNPDDRSLVETLFKRNHIQVLVSTSTLAWGVNLPAHLVIIKGTEYFDAKSGRYVDFPVTDVLQMMGRAGRPQFDTEGVAVIMVEQEKKNFYKKFVYEPFPVESSLKDFLHDHINAELVAGTIASKQDAVDFLTWTYFFRRLEQNPSFYGLHDVSFEGVNHFLSELVNETLGDLEAAHCVEQDETGAYFPTTMGRIASYYYLHYVTVDTFFNKITDDAGVRELLDILCAASEFDELPVRHNEDQLNAQLAEKINWEIDTSTVDSPHTKANILLQAYFSGLALPISDYYTDTKSVLDQSMRILQAMIDVAADAGWLHTTLNTIALYQMVIQGRWHTDSTLMQLPRFTPKSVAHCSKQGVSFLPQLLDMPKGKRDALLAPVLSLSAMATVNRVLGELPVVDVSTKIGETKAGNEATVAITLRRMSKYPRSGIHSPRFPKRMEEAWWLILGDPETNELYALRRVQFVHRTTTKLTFDVPPLVGHECKYCLYLMSDSYMGLDLQNKIEFTIQEGDAPLEVEGKEGKEKGFW